MTELMVGSTVSPMVESVRQVRINLDSVTASHFVINTEITPSGNMIFDFQFVIPPTAAIKTISSGGTHETDEIVIDVTAAGILQLYAYVGGALQTGIASLAAVDDGKLYTGQFTYTGTTAELLIGSASQGSETWALDGNQGFKRFGIRADASNEFDGQIFNTKINDIAASSTTTFKLDRLTSNTEASLEGGNSVTYTNIATDGDIRQTYSLIDGDTMWIGSYQFSPNTLDLDNWDVSGTRQATKSLVGDEVLLTALDGSNDRGEMIINDLIIGMIYRTLVEARRGAQGTSQAMLSWTFITIPTVTIDTTISTPYSIDTASIAVGGIMRVACAVAGSTGDECYVKRTSVKHLVEIS